MSGDILATPKAPEDYGEIFANNLIAIVGIMAEQGDPTCLEIYKNSHIQTMLELERRA